MVADELKWARQRRDIRISMENFQKAGATRLEAFSLVAAILDRSVRGITGFGAETAVEARIWFKLLTRTKPMPSPFIDALIADFAERAIEPERPPAGESEKD